jgi:excisionase family DNA binding protein
MYLVGSAATGKFVCRGCRSKIGAETLERLFSQSLDAVEVLPGDVLDACKDDSRAAELPRRMGDATVSVAKVWSVMEPQERQLLVDVAVSRVVVDRDSVRIVYALGADSGSESEAFSDNTLPSSSGSQAPAQKATAQGNGGSRLNQSTGQAAAAVSAGAEPKAYRIRQVAELLNCPPSTVYDMVRTGALASVRTGKDRGGVVLVPATAVEQFLEQKKRRR